MSAEKTLYTSSILTSTNELSNHCPAKKKASLEKQAVFAQGGSVLHECPSTYSYYKGFLGFNYKPNNCFLQRLLGLCMISPKAKPSQPNLSFGSRNSNFLTFSSRQTNWKCQRMSFGRKQCWLPRRRNSGRRGSSSR